MRRLWPRRRGAQALALSVTLGAFELLVWLALACTQNYLKNSQIFSRDLIGYITTHFGEITIGIATTAYVVFTYHLLQSAEATRRTSAEPYATLRWAETGQLSQYRFASFDEIARGACEWLRDVMNVTIRLEDLPVNEGRYLTLEITNAREALIAWIIIAVSAKAEIPQQKPIQMRGQEHFQNLRIGKGQSIAVTVLDLGSIPKTAAVTAWIETLVYGAADPEVLVEHREKNIPHQTVGTFTVIPVPELQGAMQTGGTGGG